VEFVTNDNIFEEFSKKVNTILHQEELTKCPRQVRLWHYGKHEVAKWMELREFVRGKTSTPSFVDVIGSHRAPWFDVYEIARFISFSVSGAMNRKLEDMGSVLPIHRDELKIHADRGGNNVLFLRRVLTHMRSIPRL
jgi:hypothetical protein